MNIFKHIRISIPGTGLRPSSFNLESPASSDPHNQTRFQHVPTNMLVRKLQLSMNAISEKQSLAPTVLQSQKSTAHHKATELDHRLQVMIHDPHDWRKTDVLHNRTLHSTFQILHHIVKLKEVRWGMVGY